MKLTLPLHHCPRFDGCSVNCCPLDPNRDQFEAIAGDDKCSLPKGRRMRIADLFPDLIPWRGLWPREASAMARWESLPAEKKAEIAERGKAVLAARRLRGVLVNLGRESEVKASGGTK